MESGTGGEEIALWTIFYEQDPLLGLFHILSHLPSWRALWGVLFPHLTDLETQGNLVLDSFVSSAYNSGKTAYSQLVQPSLIQILWQLETGEAKLPTEWFFYFKKHPACVKSFSGIHPKHTELSVLDTQVKHT